MSVLLTDEADRVVDRSPEFDQAALHVHTADSGKFCRECAMAEQKAVVEHFKTVEPLPFVPPSQGKRIDEMRRLISQQESDLTEACRHIANQGMTIRGVRADLLGLLNKLRNGVEISFHDIANIIPDSPAEFKKAA